MSKLLWRGFGLGVAIIAIVLVTLFVPILPKLVVWHDIKGLLAFLIVGCFLTGLVVLPTFSFAAFVQLLYFTASPFYWVGVGGLVALVANFLLAIIFLPYTNFIILNSMVIGGMAGGFVYSFFHQKHALLCMIKDLKNAVGKITYCFKVKSLELSPITVSR